MTDPTYDHDQPEPPPRTRYKLTVTVYGNTHAEVAEELFGLAHGGYLMATDYETRDEAHAVGGRRTLTLEQTNPEQTPEAYAEQLSEWAERRRLIRKAR